MMSAPEEVTIKKDLEEFKEEIIHEFHVVSEGLLDHMKLLAEDHSGLVRELGEIRKDNKRQHLETRALIEISFSELDRRL